MTAPISNGPTTTRLHHYAGRYYEYTPEHLQRILDAHSTTITDSNPIEGANS